MKKYNISIIFFAAILCLSSMTMAEITDVYIEPAVPNSTDDITIFISGFEVNGPVNIYNTEFAINDNLLTLDLYIETGVLDVQTFWNRSENIDALYTGQYDLNVNEYFKGYLCQTYPSSFVVIPEPSSISLLFVSTICFKKYRKKNLCK